LFTMGTNRTSSLPLNRLPPPFLVEYPAGIYSIGIAIFSSFLLERLPSFLSSHSLETAPLPLRAYRARQLPLVFHAKHGISAPLFVFFFPRVPGPSTGPDRFSIRSIRSTVQRRISLPNSKKTRVSANSAPLLLSFPENFKPCGKRFDSVARNPFLAFHSRSASAR